MLTITKEQLEIFSQIEWEKFEGRIADFLRERFVDAQREPHDKLLPVIHEQVTHARAYGFITERQIANYVTTAWLTGRQFDTQFAEVQDTLKSPSYSVEYKSEWLEQWTGRKFATLEGEN